MSLRISSLLRVVIVLDWFCPLGWDSVGLGSDVFFLALLVLLEVVMVVGVVVLWAACAAFTNGCVFVIFFHLCGELVEGGDSIHSSGNGLKDGLVPNAVNTIGGGLDDQSMINGHDPFDIDFVIHWCFLGTHFGTEKLTEEFGSIVVI